MKYTVYPPASEVFAWTRMTNIRDVSCRNISCIKISTYAQMTKINFLVELCLITAYFTLENSFVRI